MKVFGGLNDISKAQRKTLNTQKSSIKLSWEITESHIKQQWNWGYLKPELRNVFYQGPESKYVRACRLHSLFQLLSSALVAGKQPLTKC